MPHGQALIETALGAMGIAWSDRGLARLQLPGLSPHDTLRRLTARRGQPGFPADHPAASPARQDALPAAMIELAQALRRYAMGDVTTFEGVPLDLDGIDPLDLDIYRATRALRFGETITYGELAARAGHPGKAREAGLAMASNRTPLVVPCHRVLAANGGIGGFSAPGGTGTKLRLLGLEGVRVQAYESAQTSFAF